MKTRPIAQETWEKFPPEVQAYTLVLENALRQSLGSIAQLALKVNELEARLNRHSGNSSQPPSQDPPHIIRDYAAALATSVKKGGWNLPSGGQSRKSSSSPPNRPAVSRIALIPIKMYFPRRF